LEGRHDLTAISAGSGFQDRKTQYRGKIYRFWKDKEGSMGETFRYKMQHLGDIFADKLEGACEAVRSSPRGIVLTYDIHELQKKKRKIVRKIGERLTEVRKKSPELDVFKDKKMIEHFSKLGKLEKRIKTLTKEREKRLNPAEHAA